ncbi:cobaltochelatase CobN [Amycolatopsis mediterranei S699]|uniref:Cobaltochelatase CobN n=4 Tax=Amycolatopsis mediterranei TaxID=33910 RepID=A0A0H3DF03_AMYMU|nr:cobaltochelatase subunit CobN [Amycolatopsis mediterranei]ADJ48787.1 cobaltochelatase CobN [Amycolatopsis mediterranei U32]AEK45727.1 cobaltochelatase subunit CobN [Amycolatopsis mediterranei S699]AFO80496.1 cobaltochelatase CobN [Amycolatopsis mediterranei S699]AGT87624.1 cobaltochelatase CobN [Amycolatopsis mediterranei RB]KDO04004.1 cobalamin biosynthesis protein CobN [Amycolatopsis mediterranei]
MILLLSTSDTDLLSARSSEREYRLGNPSRLDVAELPGLLDGAKIVVARILGTPRSWQDGLDALRASGAHVVVLGGEQTPDAELMKLSTVPAGIAAEAHAYLAQGGPANLTQLHRFLSDTLLLTGDGFEPPAEQPSWGFLERPARAEGPVIGVLYYRAHHLSGNTAFVHTLADEIEAAGGRALPIYCASLRTREPEMMAELASVDALLVTVLAAGGTRPSEVGAGGDDEAWDVAEMAALDVPILQALCLTSDRETWAASDDGLSPLDAGNQMAVPEFDGRLITVPFSFKELDEDGLPRYVPDAERASRVARIALAHARLRHTPPPERRIALMLSAYPTKHSRVGNAVGLDTPASAIELLRRMRASGYDLGPDAFPGVDPTGTEQPDGDALIHALIAAGGQDPEWLTEEQLAGNPIRVPAARYQQWFDALPAELREGVEEHWGPAPGELYVDNGDIVLASLQSGNVIIMIQPPRGFGENPVAIYHNPDLPPSHHYLAAYRWLEEEFGAHAVVHLGKHGSLEWLPGKTSGLSASCAPDAVLGNLPLVYPFLINDPGEGAQAKRRAHATIVDHLIPPMARAESYGDMARLEQLLDEHANIAAMDPAKLPAVRQQIWTLIQAAKLDHDLGIDERPHDAEFDDFLLHIDGWLCEVKDAQIRDGLHVLGAAPVGEARVNLVLAMLRASQMWGGKQGAVPGLRSALGLKEDAPLSEVDAVEQTARSLVEAMEARSWDPGAVASVAPDAQVARVLSFAATEIVPRLAGTSAELDAVLHALDGGYIPAGPSGSPLRGLINVLPTGRNFYTVDPKAIPSRLAWETGQALADSLLKRYREDTGDWPKSVGLSVWGTSAMRTSGDDAAEVLALLGVQPVWDEASRRVTGIEAIPLAELGRPRIDVTVRISGFFRDAFPHVITLMDDAVRLVAALEEPPSENFVRAHVSADLASHGDARRATTRIFGSKPGAYGAGLLPLMDSGNWRDDKDLAEVYAVWGGFAYGRDLDGRPAREDMESSYKRIVVAAKNTDTREHDIADSDDYFQYHGGMIATVRALTGAAPASYVGDSTSPDAVRTRTLGEETARVFRARVVNPRWLAAMRRHGYKGAFELAATVDYLFGFDATAGVVGDWMYEKLTESYVLDEVNQEFLRQANPWALRGIVERLNEAADRGLWAEPDPALLEKMREVYLSLEGDLESE